MSSGNFEYTSNPATNAIKVEESIAVSDELKKSEPPFDPAVEGRKKNGSYQLSLPRSMFSSIILMPMVEAPIVPTEIFMLLHLPQYFVYLLVICAQFTLCGFLAHDARKNTNADACNEADNSSSFLRFVCVATFCSFCFSDLLETTGMCRWLNYLPTWDKKQEDLVNEKLTGSLLFEKQTKRETIGRCPDQEVTVFKPITGISTKFKSMIFLFVILPKYIIAVLLMFVGSGFIVRAEGISDIVLNTVAVSFVLQVDDFAYRGFTTSSMKILYESIPPIGLFDEELIADAALDNWERFGSPFMLVVLMVVVVVQFGCWCWL